MKPEIHRPTEAVATIMYNDYESEQYGREVWEASVKLGGREFDLTTDGSPGRCLDYVWKWAKDRGYQLQGYFLDIKLIDEAEARERHQLAIQQARDSQAAYREAQERKRMGNYD